jgi:hypothetical protein
MSKYFIIKAGRKQWEIAIDIGETLSEECHQWCISLTTEDNKLTMKRVEQEEFLKFNNLNKPK